MCLFDFLWLAISLPLSGAGQASNKHDNNHCIADSAAQIGETTGP